MVGLLSFGTQATAASDITDRRYQYSYFTNGDFQQDGDDKQFMFYEYLPSGLSWDTLNQMTVNAVSEGTRCNYRVFGYRSGGGGTLVYDSGDGGEFGVAIDITGANFDYFNVILSVPDGAVGNIDSCYIVYAWGELVQLPTTPPELIDSAAAIESGINGTATETLPQNITTVTYTTMSFSDRDIQIYSTSFGTGWQWVTVAFDRLYRHSTDRIANFIAIFLILAPVAYILTKGW